MLRAPDVGRRPFSVRTDADVDTVMDKMHQLAPIIETSAVTGEGLDLLRRMLFNIPKRRRHEVRSVLFCICLVMLPLWNSVVYVSWSCI